MCHHPFLRGVLHFRQPYICPTSFPNKAPQLFSSVTNRTMKSGHHGCTPKQVWIRNFLFSMVFNVVSGVRVFLYEDQWWVSVVSEQKIIALSPCRFSLGWFLDVDGLNLVSERDREISLESERDEREGSNRDRRASECWKCLDCEGSGGMICAGRWRIVWSSISGWSYGQLLLIFFFSRNVITDPPRF